jgi:hypothetical protein
MCLYGLSERETRLYIDRILTGLRSPLPRFHGLFTLHTYELLLLSGDFLCYNMRFSQILLTLHEIDLPLGIRISRHVTRITNSIVNLEHDS